MRTGGPDLGWMVRWEKGGGKEECSGGRNREEGKMAESSYLTMGAPHT